MKRSDEIIEALKRFFKKYECYMDADTKLLYVGIFTTGVTWADKHPNLESIWHDATEEPQGDYEIMCQDELKHVWLTGYGDDIGHHENGWEECAACERIVRWAYIKDLLPKNNNA